MTRFGISQAGLAERLDIVQGTVSGWFNRGFIPHPKTMKDLADVLGVRPEWLLKGEEPKLNARSSRIGEQVVQSLPLSKKTINSANAFPAGQVLMIPKISWAQAGIATAFEMIPEEWQERIPAAVNDETAFAIQLRGDSMEPKYQDGDVAIVLPQTMARNGDLVIANIKEDGFAFKILNLVGGDPRRVKLSSYNSAYAPTEYAREDLHWIYPVHSVTKMVRK